jgi:hypothetical protein
MDQAIRNKLRGVVTQCRRLLEDSVRDELQGKFGVYVARKDDVQVDDEARMTNLGDEERAARKDILDHFDHIKARGFNPKDALDQLVREVAFTHLNRLCAYKMMEARQVYVGDQRFREAVSRGVNSNGVKFYLADHADDERLFMTGKQDVAYRHFLDWLGGLLSEEIGVLFSPHDPANRLYPPQRVLDEVLALINDEALADIWTQDETIGWVYQYFTPKELREQARKESAAPRNSYELAFRNQFFTPRYVVEFLTDNTLGRIWYEMQKSATKLKNQCRYIVRRPSEVFLTEGQKAPEDAAKDREDLPQDELLKLAVYVPHRPKKDPRDLKILDPACGSGHFLLYCFDLLLTIYEEGYTDPDLGPALQRDYPTLDALRREVPRLILAHNLHGIDIDLRASQIAALALWLRCQRAYQDMGLKKDRPKIARSNFVCAEPMPGEDHMLKEFVGQIQPKLLGQLVEVVFDKMKLAGEAGSLLKIEEEIRDAVAVARKQWLAGPVSIQRSLFDDDKPVATQQRFDFSGITDAQFFEQAETKVVEALRTYAEKAQDGQRLQRRLFTEDAMRGFAFVDLCHSRFDVVLMNPPFGEASKPAKLLIEKHYPRTKNDLYAAFVERGLGWVYGSGLLGAITSRSGFFLSSFQKWREEILLGAVTPSVFIDLGYGVLDTAMVETAAYCVEARRTEKRASFIRLLQTSAKEVALLHAIEEGQRGERVSDEYRVYPASFKQVPGSPFAYWVSEQVRKLFVELRPFKSDGRHACVTNPAGNDQRFFRCWWEVPPSNIGRLQRWAPMCKGGEFSRYYSDVHLVADWDEREGTFRGFEGTIHRPLKRPASADYFFRPGLTYSSRTQLGFSSRILPEGTIFHAKGPGIFVSEHDRYTILGVMNSQLFQALLQLQMAFGSYEVGVIQRTPVPDLATKEAIRLAELTRDAVRLKIDLDRADETGHQFTLPALIGHQGNTLAERHKAYQEELSGVMKRQATIQSEIDDLAYRMYEISEQDRRAIETAATIPSDLSDATSQDGDDDDEGSPETDVHHCVSDVLSYSVGAVFGRWDFAWLIVTGLNLAILTHSPHYLLAHWGCYRMKLGYHWSQRPKVT